MKRRILSFMLVMCMVLSLLPATVDAAETNMTSGNLDSAKPTKAQIQAKWYQVTSASTVYDEEPSVVSPYSIGALSDSFLQSGLTYLNYVRFVANLPAVRLTDEMNEAAQYGAVLMAAGDDFSHYPHQPADMDDTFYNKGVSATSSSNISWNMGYSPLKSLQIAVKGCMDDSGANNVSTVGHRRWLLNPTLLNVGFGFAQAADGGNYTATKVFDRSGSTVNYDFIAWPASGNFPTNLLGTAAPWSITLNPSKYRTPSLSNVVITMTRESDGKQWTFNSSTGTPSTTAAYMTVETSGYGINNCIIFRPATSELTGYDGIYTVDVSGIYTSAGTAATLHYQVDFFDVSTYSSDSDGSDDSVDAGHTHSYTATVTAPSCTADGYTTYTCSCGSSYTGDETDALGHDYTSEVTKEATAAEDGVLTYTCSRCGDTYTETIPATGVTEPEDPDEEEIDGLTFSTFEELKQIASVLPDDYTEVTYVGEGDLIIEDNIIIPDNLAVIILDDAVIIPDNITLTTNGTGELYVGSLTVNGKLTNNGTVSVMGDLTVNGSMKLAGDLYMLGGADGTVTNNGTITYSNNSSIIWMCGYSDGETLAAIATAASKTTDPNWYYMVYPESGEVTLNTSVTVPGNCQFMIPDTLKLTLASNCALTLDCNALIYRPMEVDGNLTVSDDGYVILFAPLVVNGVLKNQGAIDIYYDDGGSLTVPNAANYDDDGNGRSGVTFITSDVTALPSDAIFGLDLSDFTIREYDDTYGHYWALYFYDYTPSSGHTHRYTTGKTIAATCTDAGYTVYTCSCGDSYNADFTDPTGHTYKTTVVAPTCVEGGYSIYTCSCGDSYNANFTDSTGVHTYTDALDPNCNVCGAIRQIESGDKETETTPMYRLYNPNSGEHFYTGSVEERENLVTAGWKYEGVAWNAPIKDGAPVYRLFNPNSGDHHYTMSWDETENLVGYGWKYEGVAWNSAGTSGVPQFRLYNPNADCGSHHYTSSEEERDYLVSLGWHFEGIGWFGAGNHHYKLTHVTGTCTSDGYDLYVCTDEGCGYSYRSEIQYATGHSDANGVCAHCGETLVWIPTNGGIKYHTHSGCSNMEDPIQVTVKEAIELGFTPCQRCY